MRGNETEGELEMSGKLREFESGRKTKYDRTKKLKRQKGMSQQSLSFSISICPLQCPCICLSALFLPWQWLIFPLQLVSGVEGEKLI